METVQHTAVRANNDFRDGVAHDLQNVIGKFSIHR